MTGRLLAVLGALAAGVLLLCTGAVGALFPSAGAQGACGPRTAEVDGVTAENLAADQRQNATAIIQVGQQMGVPPRGWVIAVATALQESLLHNSSIATDHDSIGVFQQRPSSGWGRVPADARDDRTPAQRLADPRYAAAQFYRKLLRTPGWQSRLLADVAQVVQISAFPERYARWEPLATRLISLLAAGAAPTSAAFTGRNTTAADGSLLRCATPGQISAAGWITPAAGQIGSGFRPPDRPGHAGVDIIAPRYTVIRAAGAGTVITATCNASTGNCDVDGSPAVKGCGWYVEIAHTTGLTTRYCHMVERPAVVVGQTVEAGQPLGKVGSSGNSSGPHLHFETRVNGVATDPVPFMAARGAPLGKPG